jgi:hypothetical protein
MREFYTVSSSIIWQCEFHNKPSFFKKKKKSSALHNDIYINFPKTAKGET